jgi:hypothetical protein
MFTLFLPRSVDYDVVVRLCRSILHRTVMQCPVLFHHLGKEQAGICKRESLIVREGYVCETVADFSSISLHAKAFLLQGKEGCSSEKNKVSIVTYSVTFRSSSALERGRFDRPTMITLPSASPQNYGMSFTFNSSYSQKGNQCKSFMFSLHDFKKIMHWGNLLVHHKTAEFEIFGVMMLVFFFLHLSLLSFTCTL